MREYNRDFKKDLERRRQRKWLKLTYHQQQKEINDVPRLANVTDSRKYRRQVRSMLKDNTTKNSTMLNNSTEESLTNENNPTVMNNMETREIFRNEDDATKSSTMLNSSASMMKLTINDDNSILTNGRILEYNEPPHNTLSTAGPISTSGNVTTNPSVITPVGFSNINRSISVGGVQTGISVLKTYSILATKYHVKQK